MISLSEARCCTAGVFDENTIRCILDDQHPYFRFVVADLWRCVRDRETRRVFAQIGRISTTKPGDPPVEGVAE